MYDLYANICSREPEIFLQGDFVRDLEEIETKIKLTDPREERDITYYISMKRIYQAKTRFLHNRKGDQCEIDKAVDKAKAAFEYLVEYTRYDYSIKYAKSYSEFLVEFEYYDDALFVAKHYSTDNTNAENLTIISSKFKTGNYDEAITLLIDLLKKTSFDAKRVTLGLSLLLYKYIMSKDIKVNEALVSEAKNAIKLKFGLIMNTCMYLLNENDIQHAHRFYELLEWLEADAKNVLHIKLRILLKQIQNKEKERSPAEAAAFIKGKYDKNRSLLDDEYIRAVALEIISHDSITSFDPDFVWNLATTEKIFNAINCNAALKWQIRSGNLDRWAERFLYVLKLSPGDQSIQKLTKLLWENNEIKAAPVLASYALMCCEKTNLQINMIQALENIPSEFFFTNEFKNTIAQLFSKLDSSYNNNVSKKRYTDTLISGLSRAQIDVWYSPDECLELTRYAAKCIDEFLPNVGPEKWSQWLGAARENFEKTIVEKLENEVVILQEKLSSSLICKMCIDILEDFLKSYRKNDSGSDDVTIVINKDWLEIEKFCFDSIARSVNSSDYWRGLDILVNKWYSEINENERSKTLSAAYLRLHQVIEKQLLRQLSHVRTVILGKIHDFKTHVKNSGINLEEILPKIWRDTFNRIVNDTHAYIKYNRRPVLFKIDLRGILEEVAYDLPFVTIVPTNMREGTEWSFHPKLYAVRPDNPVYVPGDRELLVEAVKSLLMNSLKSKQYPRKNGGWIWAEVLQEDQFGCLRIIDNGKGVNEYILRHLNDPDSKPFSGTGSTGYGTRLCHIITSLHGGTLKFSNGRHNVGLQVDIRLPIWTNEMETNYDQN